MGGRAEALSEDSRAFVVQASGVRDARSGSVGAARLYRAEGRFARRRKIAGQARHQRAGRVSRFLRRDLVGGRAALVVGKIGLLGISYYAAGQWAIAAQRPPYLSALLPWQGTYDFFRDRTRSDGIFSAGFLDRWWNRTVLRSQYGNAESPYLDIVTGARSTGPASLSPAELKANREDYIGNVLAHPTLDDWYKERSPDLSTDRAADARGRELGRARAPSARHHRRMARARLAREMAQGAVGPLFHHLPHARDGGDAAPFLRPLSEGHRERLGERAARRDRGALGRRQGEAQDRGQGLAAAGDEVDEAFARCGREGAGRGAAGRGGERVVSGAERGRDVHRRRPSSGMSRSRGR